jgi:LPXTG-motif cell wall-anchored protein
MAVLSRGRWRLACCCLAALTVVALGSGRILAADAPLAKSTPVSRSPVDLAADDEDTIGQLDPVLQLQLLSAILIVSTDDIQTSVTRAPTTSSSDTTVSQTSSGASGAGTPAPHAPEPASLALGGIGTGLALVAGILFRRRRKRNDTRRKPSDP